MVRTDIHVHPPTCVQAAEQDDWTATLKTAPRQARVPKARQSRRCIANIDDEASKNRADCPGPNGWFKK